MDSAPASPPPRALLGWRLLALVYDVFPALGLWFAVAAAFTLLHRDAVVGGWLGFAEFLALWLATGLYAVLSWRRGGATLGMRPWRLRVVAAAGGSAAYPALWKRYVVGTLSLLFAGAGFWWALFDRERLAWHDRASGTRMVRDPQHP
jgi:uncharacterized RDD family membrane protein YckC